MFKRPVNIALVLYLFIVLYYPLVLMLHMGGHYLAGVVSAGHLHRHHPEGHHHESHEVVFHTHGHDHATEENHLPMLILQCLIPGKALVFSFFPGFSDRRYHSIGHLTDTYSQKITPPPQELAQACTD